MCIQAVGLIQAEIERSGIPTVSISLLKEVTTVIQPPRSLFVPFPMGYPIGKPHDPELQHRVLQSALSLLSENNLPILKDFAH
jgi:D-proline reductase (dithiol) PrdB